MQWGKTAAAVAAIVCGVWVGSMLTTFASGIPAAGQPGSAEDPMVTKSYVDEQIRKALGGGSSSGGGAGSGTIVSPSGGGEPYSVVELPAGHTLMGGMGTEFTVRTGKAYVFSNTENGIPDLTDGVDLKNGALIPNNHLLQVPREGRGVRVEANYPNKVFVTVKGAYLQIDGDGNAVLK